MNENRNTYLDQVVAQQAELESDLRSKRASAPYEAAAAPAVAKRQRALPTPKEQAGAVVG